MKCYRSLLNISYEAHVTNEEICRKIQVAVGEYDELLILVKTESKVVWLRLNVFWFSKDDPKGHSEQKKEKR